MNIYLIPAITNNSISNNYSTGLSIQILRGILSRLVFGLIEDVSKLGQYYS